MRANEIGGMKLIKAYEAALAMIEWQGKELGRLGEELEKLRAEQDRLVAVIDELSDRLAKEAFEPLQPNESARKNQESERKSLIEPQE